mgnify:CR=1 FL=1
MSTAKNKIFHVGKLGIGNASPLFRLEVGDGTSGNDPASGYQFRINAYGDYIFALAKQSNASFSIRNNSTTVVHLNTQNSKRLALGVSASSNSGSIEEHVTIKAGGNVGINQNSPSSKLHITGGEIRVDVGGSADGIIGEAYSGYFGLKHIDQSINSEYMILSNDNDTFISCSSGYSVRIRPSANTSAHELLVQSNVTLAKAAFGAGRIVIDPDSYSDYSGGFGNINDGSGWGASGMWVHGGGTGDAAAIAHNGGNLYFGLQNGSAANSMATYMMIEPTGDICMEKNVKMTATVLRRSQHQKGHLEGGYNNIGPSGVKTSPIYTIGSAYNPNENDLNNMYGIGYADKSASFINSNCTSGWGQYIAADGDARIFLNASDGRIFANASYNRVLHQRGHLEGGHNNISSTDTKTSPIYTIGSSYRPNESDLGNMYGVGFSHGNASFIESGLGWGMYVASDGDARIFLDASNGYIKFNGGSGVVMFTNGSWSGEHSDGKIQTHASNMYFQSAGGSWQFRNTDGTAAKNLSSSGTFSASDESLKKDISTITNSVDTIKKLIGRSFTWKINDEKSFGVIAQEIEPVLPDLVSILDEPEGSELEPKKMVNYEALTGHFIEAIKELSAKIETLEQENTSLKARVTTLEG